MQGMYLFHQMVSRTVLLILVTTLFTGCMSTAYVDREIAKLREETQEANKRLAKDIDTINETLEQQDDKVNRLRRDLINYLRTERDLTAERFRELDRLLTKLQGIPLAKLSEKHKPDTDGLAEEPAATKRPRKSSRSPKTRRKKPYRPEEFLYSDDESETDEDE